MTPARRRAARTRLRECSGMTLNGSTYARESDASDVASARDCIRHRVVQEVGSWPRKLFGWPPLDLFDFACRWHGGSAFDDRAEESCRADPTVETVRPNQVVNPNDHAGLFDRLAYRRVFV